MSTTPETSSQEREKSRNAQSHHVERPSREGVKVVHTDGTIDYIDAKAIGGEVSAMPSGYYRSPQFIGTVVASCLQNICGYVSWVMPSSTLALINASLDDSPNINWVATTWTLGNCVAFLLVGRMSDIFGRRWLVMGTAILGLIGSIIGACAQNVDTLIVANVFNGFAAAGQLSFNIVLGELVPNKMRAPIISLVFFAAMPFAVFGPIFSRLLIYHTQAGWRWCYYMSIIFGAISLLLYFFLYHPPTYQQLHVGGKSKMQQLKELDFIGTFLFATGCVLFLVGLSWGGVQHPWASAATLCPLLIGLVTLAAFGVYEAHFCKVQPLMPPRLFRSIGYVAIMAISVIGAMVYFALTIIWPVLIESLYTTDQIRIGLQGSVVGGGILLGQMIAGMTMSYVPRVKWQAIIATIISFTFLTSLISVNPDRWEATIGLGTVALTAMGFLDNISFPGVTLVVEPQDIGLAVGIVGSMRALGGSVAQALYVSVLNNKLKDYLPQYVVPAATEAGLPASSLESLFAGITAGDFSAIPGITPEIIATVTTAVKSAYAHAFAMVFKCTIPFSIIYIVAAFFVPELDKLMGNKFVAKRLQEIPSSSSSDIDKTASQPDQV